MCFGSWKLDQGSAATLVVMLLAGISVSLTALASGLQLARQEVRLQGIADNAAVVAADTLNGVVAGYPCENAEQIVSRNGANLISCRIVSSVASVRVGLKHPLGDSFKEASAEADGGQY